MTDITKSNDSKELQLALEKIASDLKPKLNIKDAGDGYIPLQIFYDFIRALKKIESLFHVCCFSEDMDSLSQWAMYSNDATGIAIGFDKNKFSKLKNQCDGIDFDKVEYTTEPISEIIDNKLNGIVDIYKNKSNNDDLSWCEEALYFLFNDIRRMTYLYKNHSFEQEHEYRLVFNSMPYRLPEIGNNKLNYEKEFIKDKVSISDEFELGEIDYYISKGKLVSYRPLKIKNMGSIINEIVTAPKTLITKNDIKMFLKVNNIDLPDYKIIQSKSTYR